LYSSSIAAFITNNSFPCGVYLLELMAKRLRHFWTKEKNVCVMKCCYKSQPDKRGYRKQMFAIWKIMFPDIHNYGAEIAGSIENNSEK